MLVAGRSVDKTVVADRTVDWGDDTVAPGRLNRVAISGSDQ